MFNEFAKDIHENAVAHGWWEEERSFAEIIALCHSELSEALEEYRNGRPMLYVDDFENETRITDISKFDGKKPEGISVEMADCIIRILDYCGKANIDVDEYIKDLDIFSPIKKAPKELAELITSCHCDLSAAYMQKNNITEVSDYLSNCISIISFWCKQNDVDLIEIIRIKHEYNKTRPYKHGGKVI